jgi:hypothetical protein
VEAVLLVQGIVRWNLFAELNGGQRFGSPEVLSEPVKAGLPLQGIPLFQLAPSERVLSIHLRDLSIDVMAAEVAPHAGI